MLTFSQKENNTSQKHNCLQWEANALSSNKELTDVQLFSRQQKLVRKIYRWLARLSSEERQFILTETCPEFTQLLLQLLNLHEKQNHSLLSAIPLPSSGEFKVISLGVIKENIKNSSVHEGLLLSEVSLFTKELPLDSITVSHKLVDDVQFLMDCFCCVSNNQYFQFSNKALNEFKGNNIIQCFPSWFSNSKGCTIYQWVEAFFEYLIMKRYYLMNIEGESGQLAEYINSIKRLFEEHNNLINYWETSNRPKLLQQIYNTMTNNEIIIKFLLYAGLNTLPSKFIDSLYFSPLNGSCNYII